MELDPSKILTENGEIKIIPICRHGTVNKFQCPRCRLEELLTNSCAHGYTMNADGSANCPHCGSHNLEKERDFFKYSNEILRHHLVVKEALIAALNKRERMQRSKIAGMEHEFRRRRAGE